MCGGKTCLQFLHTGIYGFILLCRIAQNKKIQVLPLLARHLASYYHTPMLPYQPRYRTMCRRLGKTRIGPELHERITCTTIIAEYLRTMLPYTKLMRNKTSNIIVLCCHITILPADTLGTQSLAITHTTMPRAFSCCHTSVLMYHKQVCITLPAHYGAAAVV